VKESKVSGEVDVEVDIDGKEKKEESIFQKLVAKRKDLNQNQAHYHLKTQKNIKSCKRACLQKSLLVCRKRLFNFVIF